MQNQREYIVKRAPHDRFHVAGRPVEPVSVKDLSQGWKYYVILDEVHVKIVTRNKSKQPERFLSVADAADYGEKYVGFFSILEMFARTTKGAPQIVQHIATHIR